MKTDKDDIALDISQWVARHKNAIQTTARYSGEDLVVTAVRLYRMAHKQHNIEHQEAQIESALKHAA